MKFVNVLAEVVVADFDAAVAWYQRFFGRTPDRRPMAGLVEWQLTPGGGLQIFHSADGSGTAHVTLAVDDVGACVAGLGDRGIEVEAPSDSSSGRFRIATIQDPDGNTIVLAQGLGDAAG